MIEKKIRLLGLLDGADNSLNREIEKHAGLL